MSDWMIATISGQRLLAHSGEGSDSIHSVRDDIEEAESLANRSGRTLVFVYLFTENRGDYYYPLQFLDRLSEFPRLTIGPGCGFKLWRDPRYRQRRTQLSDDSDVNYQDGTMPL